MISQIFPIKFLHIYLISVSGHCMRSISKTCQTVFTSQFLEFFNVILAGLCHLAQSCGLKWPLLKSKGNFVNDRTSAKTRRWQVEVLQKEFIILISSLFLRSISYFCSFLFFQPPRPHRGWQSYDAVDWAPVCPQPVRYVGATKNAPNMDEDCLYLNVYTPSVDSGQAQKFPVMFYIHDGQFAHGSGNEFPGHQLAANGQVNFSNKIHENS